MSKFQRCKLGVETKWVNIPFMLITVAKWKMFRDAVFSDWIGWPFFRAKAGGVLPYIPSKNLREIPKNTTKYLPPPLKKKKHDSGYIPFKLIIRSLKKLNTKTKLLIILISRIFFQVSDEKKGPLNCLRVYS